MRRREDRGLTKHTVNFYAGDYAKLQTFYPPRIGAGKIIRDVIHAHIRKIEEDAAQKIPFNLTDLDLDEDAEYAE
jgi:hypothetical protein